MGGVSVNKGGRPTIGPAKEIRFTREEWERLATMGAAMGHTATGQAREIVRAYFAAVDAVSAVSTPVRPGR